MFDLEELLVCAEGQNKPKNFFIFAGAGSGKTYTLVKLLDKIKGKWGRVYKREGRKIAVITYTNAATDEIMRRTEYDTLFHISTIHSFVWDVISAYQTDIKRCYVEMKQNELEELKGKQAKAKNKETKTYKNTAEKIEKIENKLSEIESIVKFTYNPNGENFEKESLNHEEVIKISAKLMTESKMLQVIISQKYPFVLVDESQDTKKEIVDALLKISSDTDITIGFIGDTKQRIYSDGKPNMVEILPEDWNKPVLTKNFRSGKRIVELGNKIGEMIAVASTQTPNHEENGVVHLFIVTQQEECNKSEIEENIAKEMVKFSGDGKWIDLSNDKILVLEHLMAAKRMGFADFFECFSHVSKYSQSFLQGKVSDMSLFTNLIIPLIDAIKQGDNDKEMDIIRNYSPLMKIRNGENAYNQIKKCAKATEKVKSLIEVGGTIGEVIRIINETSLFPVNDIIKQASEKSIDDIDEDELLTAWIKAMDIPFLQLRGYYDYVNEKTRFATHQGVKGLQYDRVMAIIDDAESKGFLFSYDKAFGVKPLSETDKKNAQEGKETSVERTLRLLYVICTRAVQSLAIVMYTSNAEKAKETAIRNGWFSEEEISVR